MPTGRSWSASDYRMASWRRSRYRSYLFDEAKQNAGHRRGPLLAWRFRGGHFGLRGNRARLLTLLPPKWRMCLVLPSKIFSSHARGTGSTFRLKFALPSRFKRPREAADPGSSFFPFREACPDLFPSRALPAAGCDSKLSLGSGVQSSELSRQSLAYPGPTEINLAWSVRNRGCPGPARFGNCKRVGDQSL